RFPMSRFQPGIAAMYACTGASPSAFAICGLPPERSFVGLAFAPAFIGDLDLVADLRGLPARDASSAFGFALLIWVYRFLDEAPFRATAFRATAAFTSAWNAPASIVSPW